MNQFKTDSRTGLQYELQGDYYVIAGEGEDKRSAVGIWGQRHQCWLKQCRRVTYTNLLTAGKLNDYLREIDAQANGQLDALITHMVKAEGVTEPMPATRTSISSVAPTTRKTTAAPAKRVIISGQTLWRKS